MWKTYTVVINQSNKLYSKKHGNTFLPINPRTLHSIKSHWNAKLQPCINKFASLVALNMSKSGQVQDDKQMDLYWGEMCRLYAERAAKNKYLPKTMDIYFQSYIWLMDQPWFEEHVGSRDNSGSTLKISCLWLCGLGGHCQ